MKRILIATDFSPASDKALEYGAKLAQSMGAEITLASAFEEVPVPVTGIPIVITTKDMRTYIENQLLVQAALCKAKPDIPVQTLAVEGPVSRSLLDLAAEIHADLIIAGVKKSGTTLRRIFGDTLTALARKTTIPLLVIPEEFESWPPKAILLGEDLDPAANIHLLDTLLEIASVFNSTLYVMKALKNDKQGFIAAMEKPYGVKRLEKFLDVQYEYPVDKDAVHAINEFAEKYSIGMVALVPHPHFAPERWLVKGHTWSMIFRTKVPLLILPETS